MKFKTFAGSYRASSQFSCLSFPSPFHISPLPCYALDLYLILLVPALPTNKWLNTCSHPSLLQIEYAICLVFHLLYLFLLFCSSSVWFPSVPFVSLFLQVFITNLKFQFSQSNESFKLICPLVSTACKFILLLFPGCALFVHLPVVAMSTLVRSISQQQQKNLEG